MIAVDSSALVAILMDEPERDAFLQRIADRQPAFLSAVSLQEAGMVMRSRHGDEGMQDPLDLLAVLLIRVVPFDENQAKLSVDAFARFGREMGSPAKLNLGDCAAYAMATSMKLPLLYKGDDFANTDIAAAM